MTHGDLFSRVGSLISIVYVHVNTTREFFAEGWEARMCATTVFFFLSVGTESNVSFSDRDFS